MIRPKRVRFGRSLIALTVAIFMFATRSSTIAQHVHPVFKNPPMIASRDGRLDVYLTAAPATYTLGGHRFNGMLYNGVYVPPVWRVQAGDKVYLTLHNQLTEDTNFHFHGLDVSPLGNGDNVYLHIHPGQTFNYQVTVPQKHVGLFWFHPHLHGDVDRQIIGGLSGAFVVAGSERVYPLIERLPERVFLFKHHPIGRADYQELVTVNGIVEPDIPIRPGEAQFWELANIGADRFLKVGIKGMPLYVIGRDGYFVPRPITMDSVELGPGERVAAIVIGNRAGRYAFESLPFKFDVTMPILPRISLGTVVSQGPFADVATVTSRVLAQHANGPLYVDSLRSQPIAHRRTFTFSRNAQKTKFFINGKVFNENRNDVTVRLGDTEEWTILNKDTQYHDFHIHQTGFLVTEVNGQPARFDGLRDTFSVPPMVNGRHGEIRAIIPFTNPVIVGRFVFHCHVVKHEDKGMMMSIEVEPLGAAGRLPDFGPVPHLALRDAVTDAPLVPQLGGKNVLVSFIAASCSDTCPLTEAKFARVQELLKRTGRLGSHVALVLVTVDPAHDTPTTLRQLAQATGANPKAFHYATGSQAAVNEVLRGYGISVAFRKGSSIDPDHTDATYLVDKTWHVRAVFSPNDAPSKIARTIERLL